MRDRSNPEDLDAADARGEQATLRNDRLHASFWIDPDEFVSHHVGYEDFPTASCAMSTGACKWPRLAITCW